MTCQNPVAPVVTTVYVVSPLGCCPPALPAVTVLPPNAPPPFLGSGRVSGQQTQIVLVSFPAPPPTPPTTGGNEPGEVVPVVVFVPRPPLPPIQNAPGAPVPTLPPPLPRQIPTPPVIVGELWFPPIPPTPPIQPLSVRQTVRVLPPTGSTNGIPSGSGNVLDPPPLVVPM